MSFNQERVIKLKALTEKKKKRKKERKKKS